MSAHEHVLGKVVSKAQHPYKHLFSEITYTNAAMPGVVNAQSAMDWLVSAIYPNPQEAVDTPGDLPAAGNNIGDYRIVTDDGDGNAAGYMWQSREADAGTPQWYKIYDLDWGVGTIVSSYLSKTIDHYVYRHGFDDLDETGTAFTGVAAGQHIYGGASANTHLTLHANSGDTDDTAGNQTGYVQVADHFRPQVDSTWDLGTNTERWANAYLDSLVSGTMTITGGSITDSSGAIDFGNEALTSTGAVTGGSFVTGTTTISSGSIDDSGGSIAFNNIDFTGVDRIYCGRIDCYNLIFTTNAIYTNTGNLDIILEPHGTGEIDARALISGVGFSHTGTGTITGQLDVDNLTLDGNTISSSDIDGAINIHPNGTGEINLHDGVLTIASTGECVLTGGILIDSLDIDGNTISTLSSNTDVVLSPHGTGVVQFAKGLEPNADDSLDLGAAASRFGSLYLGTAIGDGTNTIAVSVLMALRDITSGISTGDGIFWDGSKFVGSNPDSEIDHGELLGSSLSDDDHTQYCLLAGRSTGQTFIGGTGAGEDLTLGSTSNASKGEIVLQDSLRSDTDDTDDLGTSSYYFKDLYLKGQAYGLRIENFADSTARGAVTPTEGRVGWQVDTEELYIGLGASWKQVSTDAYYNEDASGWTGSVSQVSYDVSTYTDDARKMVWQFKDNSNDYEIMAPQITHTSATNVTVTFGFNLTSGTYTLVGR